MVSLKELRKKYNKRSSLSISSREEDDLLKEKIYEEEDSIVIGYSDNGPVCINPDILATQKMLISGASGSGKSRTLRTIIEKLIEEYEKSHFIIIDNAGEFITLREEYEFIIYGRGDSVDIQINEENVKNLAELSINKRINTIFNISDFEEKDNKEIVIKEFLEQIFNLQKKRKKDGRKVFLVIEEAHEFTPRAVKDASVFPAIKNIIKIGRKHNICSIFCTQKVKDINTSIRGEFNNAVLGHCQNEEEAKYNLTLIPSMKGKNSNIHIFQNLRDNHEFIAFGLCFSHHKYNGKPVKMQIGLCNTHHPGQGEIPKFPKPSENIKKIIKEAKYKKEEITEDKDKIIDKLKEENEELKLKIKELEQDIEQKTEIQIIEKPIKEEIEVNPVVANLINDALVKAKLQKPNYFEASLEERILWILNHLKEATLQDITILTVQDESYVKPELSKLIENHIIYKDKENYIICKKQTEFNFDRPTMESILDKWKEFLHDDFQTYIIDEIIKAISITNIQLIENIDDAEEEDLDSALEELIEDYGIVVQCEYEDENWYTFNNILISLNK